MYRFVDHTAELEVELEAATAEGVLTEALRAFAELAGTGDGEAVERAVDLSAGDLPLHSLQPGSTSFSSSPTRSKSSPTMPRSPLRHAGHRRRTRPTWRAAAAFVKAVTLHRLRFRPENGSWRGRVVLDV